MFYEWKPYTSVAQRKKKAAKQLGKLEKKGHRAAPVVIEGRTIASTFWGKSWCENLERYGDYANRLPRGRSYVRNGSVVDLQIEQGAIGAWVSGSDLYRVEVKISTVAKTRWQRLVADCAGEIDSLVELLQGSFSKSVMQRMCKQDEGLFPTPKEITFDCSCPDWAAMCKHVAAVLYGVGARLDQQPELLFSLRAVDEKDLIARAGKGLRAQAKKPRSTRVLDATDLGEMFGIELAGVKPRRRAREGAKKAGPRRGKQDRARRQA